MEITFNNYLRVINISKSSEIVVVDHMDCGYYHSVYGTGVDTHKKEKVKHKFNLHKFVRLMRSKPEFKDLDYVLLLAEKHSNGSVHLEKLASRIFLYNII